MVGEVEEAYGSGGACAEAKMRGHGGRICEEEEDANEMDFKEMVCTSSVCFCKVGAFGMNFLQMKKGSDAHVIVAADDKEEGECNGFYRLFFFSLF